MGGGGGSGWFSGTKGSGGKIYATSKAEARKAIKDLPPAVQGVAKRMIGRASNKYGSFSVQQLSNGNTLFKIEKPGNVPGSKAVYHKEINPEGETVRFYKETYDPSGKLVHSREKPVQPRNKE